MSGFSLPNSGCFKKSKLVFILTLMFFLGHNYSVAQVSAYTFTQNLVGYTALTGTPTTVFAAPWDDQTSTPITIPFTFTYDSLPYTQLYVNTNGFISFGTTAPTINNYNPISSNTTQKGVVAALGMDLISNGSDIVYDVVGVAPNRTFVIQWATTLRKTGLGNFNFQIRLNETTNGIDLAYGACAPTAATTITCQVGLRGSDNNAAQGNINNRQQGSSTVWFGNTGYFGINISTLQTSNSAYPDLGLYFTYTPALPCNTPTATPTSLTLGGTSTTDTSFVGNSFVAASPAPTNYLVLRSTTNVAPTAAQFTNRTYYTVGTSYSGFRVVSTSAALSFNQTGLLPSTTYYYWIIPFNDRCAGAPFYKIAGMLTGNATTCSPSTTATAATAINGNGFTANWTVATGATGYIFDLATDAAFTMPVAGYSNLSVGNVTSFVVTGLLPVTTYYYKVRANGAGCVVVNPSQTVTTTCGYYTVPYFQNFDSFPTGVLPTCYNRVDANGDGFQWQTQSISYASASRSMHMSKSLTQDMNDWFFVPGIYLTAGVSYRLIFKYNTGNTANFFENLRVRLGNAPTIAGMTENLLDLSGLNDNIFQTVSVDFISASTGVFYLGFQGYSVANQSYLVIDDINVIASPTCFDPKDVNTIAVTNTTATVTWTASTPVPANGYEYYLSTSNTPPTSATAPTGTLTGTTLNLSGLNPSTYYYIFVRGNCSAVDKSVWTPEESFSTECSIPVITSTTPTTRCGYGTSTLAATTTSGTTLSWYASSTSTVPLATGTSFTTPANTSSTTYYIEAKSYGAIAKAAPVTPLAQGGTIGTQNFQGSAIFNVLSDTSLQSVDIYPIVSGQAGQIVVRNNANVTLATIPFTTSVSGGLTAQIIPINYSFTVGTYNIYLGVVPAAGIKYNVTDALYPYSCAVADITGNSIDNSNFLGFYNWKFTTQCVSPRLPITATVTPPPALTISTASSVICSGYSTATITVSGYGAYSSLVWSPNTGISGSFASGFTFNPTTTTTYTLLATQSSGSFCGNILTHTVTVNPLPPTIMVVPSTSTICENTIQPLNGSSGATAAVPILVENFNGATPWTVANTSIGGDTTASQWTVHPNNYSYTGSTGWSINLHSNDATNYILANSDAQSSVIGILTRTTLTSPNISLAGYTSASVNYWQYLRYIPGDLVYVQVSTDGGATWNTVKTYTSSQRTAAEGFVNDTVDLTAYIGISTVQLRFSFSSLWGYAWGLDNITVSGTLAAALTWLPVTGLFTDAGATIPYIAGNAAAVVYAKPSVTTTYTATITGSNSCFRNSTSVVNVVGASNPGTISANQIICSNTPASNITLTGYVGSILRWEYADDALFTTNLTSISNTTSILTAAQMGVFTTIRYFRAVVKSGFCPIVYSAGVSVAYVATTWNGTAWSNGAPTASTRAIFAGDYASTGTLYACSVLVISGNIIINSNNTLVVTNEVTVSGGTLFFDNNASLVQINSAVNTGNITYTRTTLPMKRYDFTYWSSPVELQIISGVSPLTLSDKYLSFDPVINNWVSVPPLLTVMAPGKGYIIRAPQTYSITTAVPYTASFVGVPNNGTITTPIAIGAGNFNLIGNPYPSALSADLFLSDPSNVPVVDATIYLWTHNTPVTSYQYASNDYAAYNYLGGTGTSSALNIGVNPYVPNGKIASGQSFFIKGLSNGTATYRNSMRVIDNNNQFFKMSNTAATVTPEKHRVWLDIVDATGAYKQTLVGYDANATLGIDRGYDGTFLNSGTSINLYSIQDQNRLTIQGRPLPFLDTDEVDLGYTATVAGIATISLFNYDGLFLNQNIYLKDKLLNTYTDLKASNYSFTTATGTFENRFALVYRNTIVLSVNPFEFNANTITLYKPNTDLLINSGTAVMKSVAIYDISGRLLFVKNNINATQTSVAVGTTNQVLLVQITSTSLEVVTKKYVNQ